MKTEDTLRVGLVHCEVPGPLHEGLIAYILDGRPTGGFLRAVLIGDLFQSVARGDLPNQERLANIVRFLINYAPAGCFGSDERVDAWRDHRGLRGLNEVTT